MIVLVKKDILHFVQDVRAVRGMGRGISDHHVVLCKVRLARTWIKRRKVVDGDLRIRSERLREHQYREGYARSLKGKRVEWDRENNIEHMWVQVKWATVESVKVCGSVRVGDGNPNGVWWNDQVKAAVKRNEDDLKEALTARDEDTRERYLEAYKEKKRKIKGCIYQSKKEVQEQFGSKMNQDVNVNGKLFWKEVSKVNGRKVENSNRIKNGDERLALEEAEVQRILKWYYDDLHNIHTQKQVAVHM